MGQRTPPRNFIQIPLNGGVETRIDPAQVQPPKLLTQINFSARATGGLTPRYGQNALSASLGLQDAATMDATNDELIGLDSSGLYSYNFSVNQFIRRGDYTDYGLSTQNIVNHTVNQNYTPSQAGGVRNLSTAVIGNVGLLVWDVGSNASSGSSVGSLVYILCYDVTTGKVFWSTTCTGYTPLGANATPILVNGNQSTTTYTLNGIAGVMHPTVVAHAGKFILGMITCTASNTSVTVGGTTTTGYGYISNLFYLTPNATTGIPPKPTIGPFGPGGNTNAVSMLDSFPLTIMSPGTTLNVGKISLLDNINHYYDLVSNGTDLTFVACYASVNSSNALVYGNPSMFYAGWSDPTVAAATNYSTTVISAQYSAGTGAANPIALATAAGINVAPVFTPWASFAVNTYSAGVSRGTFVGPPVSYYGKQNGLTMGLNPIAGWPVACGMTGTASSFTAIVTDGYLVNQFTYNSGSYTGPIESYINLPMSSTRQVPMGPGAGQSTIASRMFWIPAVGSPSGSGVYEPAVWIYVASPAAGTNAGAYPGGVAPPGPGGGFSSFTNLVLVRINLAAYSAAKQNVNLSEVVARCMYLRALPFRYGTMRPPNVVQSTSLGYVVPAMQLVNIPDGIVAIKTVAVKSGQLRNVVALPQGALLTGADTRYYDGATVRSAGWIRLPELGGTFLTSITQSLSTLQPSFQYTYYFVYTEYDNYGNAIYSSPSPPYQVTTGSGVNQAVQIDTNEFWPAGSKNTAIQSGIQIFRNTSLNPLQFYRVAQVPSVGATLQYGQQYYVDTGPDDISGNALLYSPPSGGELPNDPPPPSAYAVATKQRVYVASAENGSYLYPSKPFYAGRAPVEFNAAQYVDIDPSTGPINGLANLDNTVVVFKQKAIYLLSGDGPDATGVGSFNNPYRLSVDVGLQDPQSVVSAERGVFFRSQRGIELLDRGGASVTYVGSPVENILGSNVISDSFIVPNQSQVRFVYTNSNYQSVSLVYDYVSQIWYTYYQGAGNYVSVTGKYFNGSVYTGSVIVGPTGSVLQETPGVYNDGVSSPGCALQTPFIPVAQNMHGWGRVRRINIVGNAPQACTMTVRLYYDYDSTVSKIIPTVAVPAGEFRLRFRTTRQVCQALSVYLSVQGSSGMLQAPTISSIELETSTKSGAGHQPDTGSF